MKHSEIILTLSQKLGYTTPPKKVDYASGGCIHNSQIWNFNDGKKFFIKFNQPNAQPIFQAEQLALNAIYKTKTIDCPEALLEEVIPETVACLVLEYLDLHTLNKTSAIQLGIALANLHQKTSLRFGFEEDNFIGATPQKNKWEENWCNFFWQNRIKYQLQLATKNGYRISDSKIKNLKHAVEKVLKDHTPQASLLHGDLWGGNAGSLPNNTPVIYDPASYYGDKETDIAFTEVFGGFPPEFYNSYKKQHSWDEIGYQKRKNIYNLYHYINHFNLFGSGYYSSCTRIIDDTIHQYG